MPDFRKRFIIEHEKGHFNLDTRSEFEADDYAFRKLAGTQPGSLKETVKSISQVLTFRNPEHLQRLSEIIKKALDFDYKHNGNERAKEALDRLNELSKNQKLNTFNMNSSYENDYFEPKFGGTDSDFDELYDNAGGKAKRQAKKAARKAKRQEKKATRVANRQERKATRVANRQERKTTRVANRQNAKATRVAGRVARKNIRQQAKALSPVAQMVSQDLYPEDTPFMETVAQPAESYTQPSFSDTSYPEYPAGNYPSTEFLEESPEDSEETYPDDSQEAYPEDQLDENGELINPDEYYGEWDNAAGKARRQARKAKRQARKDERQKLKNDRLAAKNEIKLARADAIKTKAGAKMELAKQGKSGSDWLGSAVDSIAGIFGGGKKSDVIDQGIPSGPESDDSGKILGMPKGVAFAVIGVVVVLIIVGIVFMLKRKK